MSELESQSPFTDSTMLDDAVSVSLDTSSQADSEPHGEHEVESSEPDKSVPLEDTPIDEETVAPEANGNSTTKPPSSKDDLTVEDITTPPADQAKKDVLASPRSLKMPVPIKTTGIKSAGPPTPLVKKILNSGTFGAGNLKNAPAAKVVTPAATSAASKVSSATTALKKSVSAGVPLSPVKPGPISKAPSTGTSATGPARRTSIAPKAPAPSASKSPTATTVPKPPLASSTSKPLSSSTSARPGSSTASKPASAVRAVVSPVGSVASVKSSATATRPRASVSDGVKKAPAARQSMAGSMKPPATTTVSKPPAAKPPVTKPTRTTGSISSIKEIREDGGRVEELQNKLREATETLSSKTEAVTELEVQVDSLKSLLQAAQSDVQAKQAIVDQLEQTKAASEAELADVKATLEKLESDDSASVLLAIQEQFDSAKASAITNATLVQTLQAQISTLEIELLAAKGNLETLKTSHASSTSDAAVAAQIDHEALLKAKADLEAIAAETEALKAAHSSALDEATAKLREQEEKVASIEALEKELVDLKAEKEESSTKLSELEIEILELKESQDQAEDDHSKSLSKLKSLEDELARAIAATQQAVDDAAAKHSEHVQLATDVKAAHEEELKAISEEQAKVTAHLEALKEELAAAQAAHEQTKTDVLTTSEDHTRQLIEAEQLHLTKQTELSEKIKEITAELEGQEAKYNAKVDTVKAEHDQLLQETFERAKHAAGAAHGQDLQALRAESQTTIEQLRTAHQSTIDDLNKEHGTLLESQVSALSKQISNQGLELKATQDDLVKAKAALEASRAEVTNLTAQLNTAKVSAAGAALDPAIAEEIERLTKALSHAHDDVAATHDALSLTKQSLTEVTDNQAKELEEAAKSRVEEVTRLKAAHEQEVKTLVGQKSDLATKLSDLEGELATLKASVSAEAPVSTKTNGSFPPASPGITKEELQRMHEAHNAKMNDLQAEHEKAIQRFKGDLEASLSKAEELQQEVTRKAMEIQYLEQEQDESADQITRLKEDMAALSEQLHASEAASA